MPKIISILSSKGGAGKSTVSVCLSRALSDKQNKVLLAELDMGLRGLDIMLAAEDKVVYDIGDVMNGVCSFEQAVVSCDESGSLNLLAASADIKNSVSEEGLSKIIESASDYDFIVFDTPAGYGKSLDLVCSLSDTVLIIVTPDAVCVRDAARLYSVIAGKCSEAGLIINNVDVKHAGRNSIKNFDGIIDEVGVKLLGVVPNTDYIKNLSVNDGAVYDELLTKKVFAAIADRLCGIFKPLIIK